MERVGANMSMLGHCDANKPRAESIDVARVSRWKTAIDS